MSAYRRDFDETKYMSFLIKDNKLLEKYNQISVKVGNSMKKEFDSEPVYNEKYIKTKIKPCEEKTTANFHGDNITKGSSHCICLSVIFIKNRITRSFIF